MAIEIKKGQQQTSMGRRLFAMAAPIVGGAFGGPAGAAAGAAIGNKIAGASTEDAIMGGLQTGALQGISKAVTPASSGSIVGRGAGGAQSAFSRALSAKSQDPQVGVAQGLSVLETLPQDDPLRQELGPSFIRAGMMPLPKPKSRFY